MASEQIMKGLQTRISIDARRPDRLDEEEEPKKAHDVESLPLPSLAGNPVAIMSTDASPKGVVTISAFRQVYSNKKLVWVFWIAMLLWAFAMALSQDTTFVYLAFATSSFQSNSLLSTISLLCGIMAGIINPFWATLADMSSRGWCLLAATMLYTIGYACTAGSSGIHALAAGQVIYTIGNLGLSFIQTLILADITSLQNRGLVIGTVSLVYVPFAFVAGDVTTAVGLENWRWGYGMFCIIMPVCLVPIISALFWAQIKGKRLQMAAAPSEIDRNDIKATKETNTIRRIWSTVQHIDAFGLILLGTACALILSPPTLVWGAKDGWKNPSMIAMIVIGPILLLAFGIWEWKLAANPIMPRVMLNRTFIISVSINFFNFIVSTLHNTYWNSWVWVIQDYNTRNYTYMTQIETVTLCSFAIIGGAIQRFTHRYKWLQVGSLALRCIGAGVTYYSTLGPNQSTVCLFFGKFLITVGNSWSIVASSVAAQASVPHKHLGMAIAILSLWSSIGGGIGSSVAGSVWPRRLSKALASTTTLAPEELMAVAGDINAARIEGLPVLPGVREAYNMAFKELCVIALPLTFVPLFASVFSADYKLDGRHNAVEEVA